MTLEVCASTFESAVNAKNAGAHRIELCQNLAVGGLTPSKELLKKVMSDVVIPTFVLIRPRAGNFTYTDDEFEVMLDSIEFVKSFNCQGIVSGVLDGQNDIDQKRTSLLIEKSFPLPFTFHRAFDQINSPLSALELIRDIGANRILTSGQAGTAERGIGLLDQLKTFENADFNILPGGGITPTNARLFKEHGFKEIHASGITRSNPITNSDSKISLNTPKKGHSDVQILSEILDAIKD